jgi:hypothetical protein
MTDTEKIDAAGTRVAPSLEDRHRLREVVTARVAPCAAATEKTDARGGA